MTTLLESLTVSVLPDQIDRRRKLNPLQLLAVGVLESAVQDLDSPDERHRESARRFFGDDDDGGMLAHWCALLDLDPATIGQAATKLLDTHHRTVR